MEGVPKQRVPSAEEAPQASTEPPRGENANESPRMAEELPDEKTRSDNIRRVKERLLSAGGMTIEPLEGDPFVLSREHVSTGEGVTIYTPDGATKKMSIETYQAQLREQARAARFFNQPSGEQRDAVQPPPTGWGARATGWLKHMFKALWLKLGK